MSLCQSCYNNECETRIEKNDNCNDYIDYYNYYNTTPEQEMLNCGITEDDIK